MLILEFGTVFGVAGLIGRLVLNDGFMDGDDGVEGDVKVPAEGTCSGASGSGRVDASGEPARG